MFVLRCTRRRVLGFLGGNAGAMPAAGAQAAIALTAAFCRDARAATAPGLLAVAGLAIAGLTA